MDLQALRLRFDVLDLMKICEACLSGSVTCGEIVVFLSKRIYVECRKLRSCHLSNLNKDLLIHIVW